MKNKHETRVGVLEAVKCEWCEEEIFDCAACNEPFITSQVIYCTQDGHWHKECADEVDSKGQG